MTDALTPTARGRYLVRTRTSTYVLDLDERTLTRHPDGATATDSEYIAADMRKDGRAVPLRALLQCAVGVQLVTVIDVRGDGVDTVRMSTEVISIDAVP